MTNIPTQSAKELVLQFVREKNPQFHFAVEDKKHAFWRSLAGLYNCSKAWSAWSYGNMSADDFSDLQEDPSFPDESSEIFGVEEMGLQEFLIALCSLGAHSIIGDWQTQGTINGILAFYSGDGDALFNYDLTQNLHNQSENFYTYLLPLING